MGAAMQGGMAQPAAPQKVKPEQMMQMLDFRLYNMQQQLTAIMNTMGVQVPPGALVTPPGSTFSPPAEAALPGGPQDPTMQAGGQGNSAISPIEPMQGASPELAQGGGEGGMPKQGSWNDPVAAAFLKDAQANAPAGYQVMLIKQGANMDVGSVEGSVDKDKPPTQSSPPNKALNIPKMGTTPSLSGPPTAGGSKDPKSRPETDAPMDAIGSEKSAAQAFAAEVAMPLDPFGGRASPVQNAAAVGALLRSRAATAAA